MGSEHRCPRPRSALIASLLLWTALPACGDPVKDAAIAVLGPELPAVPPGPLHRPGQPCSTCHDGATARELSVAGTVFWTADSDLPAPATEVLVIDGDGRTFTAVTNCAGNFLVRPEDFEPTFPLWVALRRGGAEIEMDSPVLGDGSCAGCHGLEPGPGSTGRVYLHAVPPAAGPGECP